MAPFCKVIFLSCKSYRMVLMFIFLAFSQTPAYAARPHACLRPNFCWYSLRLLLDGWLGCIDLRGLVVAYGDNILLNCHATQS